MAALNAFFIRFLLVCLIALSESIRFFTDIYKASCIKIGARG